MNIKLELPKLTDLRPRITVIGVGGAGGNAINNMIASGLEGVEFVVANTDAQALASSSAEHRIQLGVNLTEGLGAGSRPEIGQAAAEEAFDEIRSQISGSHMVFVAGGMGGGTGSGAAGVIARIAKELGILTVGIVTKPFQFEGARRMRVAEAGVAELARFVDTLIVIPNQNLFRIATERTTFAEAFVLADQVLYSGIACIVDLIVKDGLINLDFADVRTVMSGMGTAMMGTGEASGERRAILAAEEAISNPLLDDVSLKGARGLLLSIIGGRDMTLYEVDEAASRVRQEVDPEANIIVGATFDDSLGDRVRVSIVASGMARASDRSAAPPAIAPTQSFPMQVNPQAAPLPAQTSAAFEALRRSTPSPFAVPSQAKPAPSVSVAPGAVQSDNLTQMLSKAYEQHPVSEPTHPPGTPQVGAHKGEFWRAPGDVTIRTGMPNVGLGGPVGAPVRPDAGEQSQRRMPGIDDFPPVAQREYRARTEVALDATATGGPRVYHAPNGAKSGRKLGLFERLTGLARRENESKQQLTTNYPQARSGGHGGPATGANAAPRQNLSADAARGTPRTAQETELPMFFNRDKK